MMAPVDYTSYQLVHGGNGRETHIIRRLARLINHTIINQLALPPRKHHQPNHPRAVNGKRHTFIVKWTMTTISSLAQATSRPSGASHMRNRARLTLFYGHARDQLSRESEGGVGGRTVQPMMNATSSTPATTKAMIANTSSRFFSVPSDRNDQQQYT
jgi:hypothetical protein